MIIPTLSLININKEISSSFKLSNINIDFYQREICAIVGENGSGKSSLMKIISGLTSPDSGVMKFDNKVVNFNNIYDGKKQGIFYVPQETYMFDNLSVGENIFIDSLLLGHAPHQNINYNKIFHLTERLFSELAISIDPREYVKNLSLPQKQILSFIKAYVVNAKVTIFDEPSSTLTDIENNILFQVIDLLKSKGSSIIFISHKIERIKKISDKIAVLKNGSIIQKGDIKDFSIEKIIEIISESKSPSKYPKLYIENYEEILSVNSISYKDILKDISFDLSKQEIIGIIGNADSGKNSLIDCLFGAVKPSSGEIILDGKVINLKHPFDALSKGLTLVPEDKIKYSIFEHLDLKNNMAMSSLRRFSKISILDYFIMSTVAKSYVSKLRITPGNPDEKIVNYSGGNQQKVVFAKSIMHLSKIYILDEPTRGIDVASKNDIYNIMNNLLINGSSIILFTSDFNELLGMCDRILILSSGEIIAELDGKHATKEEIVYYLTL